MWQVARCAVVLGLLAAGTGCAAEAPEPVVLELFGPPDTDTLQVWIKSGGEGTRRVQTPDGEPQEVPLSGDGLAAAPFRLELQPGGGSTSGELVLHLAAWQANRTLAVGDVQVEVGTGLLVQKVQLVPWSSGCDGDGDTFSDCDLAGCCDHLVPALQDAVSDCLDTAAAVAAAREGRECRPLDRSAELAARAIHPFRPPSFGTPITICDDCLDQDCDGRDEACDFPDGDGDGTPPPYDCADDDPERHPGATERCSFRDEDCDGQTDEGFDVDGDGYKVCEGDCDDGDPAVYPGAEPVCGDGIDQTCEVAPGQPFDDPCPETDLDGDGFPGREAGGADCEDWDAGRFPGARDLCGDGVDQDCDDEDRRCPFGDEDGDGEPSVATGGGDCDDEDPLVYPGAPERCGDGVDQDCDGLDASCDGDGDGDGYLPGSGDCDDDDGRRHPGVPELCNGADDDCDGLVDEGNPLTLAGEEAHPPRCYTGSQPTRHVGACEDGYLVCTRVVAVRPTLYCTGDRLPEAETCTNEGADDDCNHVADDVPGRGDMCDTGQPGNCLAGTWQCRSGELFCQPDREPMEDLACDGVDADCDGVADPDEVLAAWHTRSCFESHALPGVGRCRAGLESCCVGIEGCRASNYGECRGQVLPRTERCNNEGEDDDCNGERDDVAGRGDSCDSGALGACAAGRKECHGGLLVCDQVVFPQNEVCNSVDDDCNGQTDETDPRLGDYCNTGRPGPCAGGRRVCTGGRLRCQQTMAGEPETCDGVDNDCDGPVDEGFQGEGDDCDVPGRPAGRCRRGERICVNGSLGCRPLYSDTPNGDADCDGVDDDCDERVDEDWQVVWCDTGLLGICRGGDRVCLPGGQTQCRQRWQAGTEVCDNERDDDCDGLTDAADEQDCPPGGGGGGG